MSRLFAVLFLVASAVCLPRAAMAEEIIATLGLERPRQVEADAGNHRLFALHALDNVLTVYNADTMAKVARIAIPLTNAFAVNEATHRVYLMHNGNGGGVTVLDGQTFQTTATIPLDFSTFDGQLPTGIAVDSAANRVYVIATWNAGLVTIDGATNRVLARSHTGPFQPVALAVNPTTHRVYAANRDSSDGVSVFDGSTGAYLTAVNVAAHSEKTDIAVNPATNRIYVTDQSGYVAVVDGATNRPLRDISLGAGMGTHGVAVDTTRNKVYAVNHDKSTVSVISGSTHAVTGTLALPEGAMPESVTVDAGLGKAYTANVESATISVINATSNAVSTPPGLSRPFAVAVNPTTNRVYTTGWYGLAAVDGATNTILKSRLISATIDPVDIAVNPATDRVYQLDSSRKAVTVLDGALAGTPVTLKLTAASARRMAVDAQRNRVYVVHATNDGATSTLSVVDAAKNTLEATVPLPANTRAWDIVAEPATNRLYIADRLGHRILVLDAATRAVVDTLAVPEQGEPLSLALDPEKRRLYVSAFGATSLWRIDLATRAARAGAGTGGTLALNPESRRLYAWERGRITVIDTETLMVRMELPVPMAGFGGLAANPRTGRVYLSLFEAGTLTVVQGPTGPPAALTPADAAQALRAAGGLAAWPARGADLNVDGRPALTVADAALLARKAAGLAPNP